MENFELVAVVSFRLAGVLGVSVLAACGWSRAQPTLLLEVRHVTRVRGTEAGFARSQAVAFTAAVSMALERAAVSPVAALSEAQGGDAGLGLSAVAGPPYPRAELNVGCDTPALCAWAQTAEESAFVAAASLLELDP